jgi:prepilin-type N-terminal cleavage/methylation domain-containing protein
MSNTFTKTSLRGFTLIELLVVIAIIGLLSTAIMGPVQTGLKKGRDTRKISDITQIQGALLQYAGDNNGKYPQYLSDSTSQYVLASTTPTYMGLDDKMDMTKSAARDRFMYVVYSDVSGNIIAYHLGVSLENQNASLQSDADCGMLSSAAATAIPSATPPITTTWGAIGVATIASTPLAKPCVSVGNGSAQFNSNAWNAAGTQAGNNALVSPQTGAISAGEDFGGYGTKEQPNDVCSAKLDTCIYDIVPN